MIIVAGPITESAERVGYLDGCREVIEAARAAEAFRGSGPSDEQTATILGAAIVQYETATATPL